MFQFAIGFGEGIGTVYNYLEDSQKQMVMSYRDGEDAPASQGVSGMGFGSVFPYLGDDVRKDILAHTHHNRPLLVGLGTGLAMHISYLSEPFGSKIFELARNNSLFAMGLGKGCGIMFQYLSPVTKDWISLHVGLDGFAFGFGIGIGYNRMNLENNVFEETPPLLIKIIRIVKINSWKD